MKRVLILGFIILVILSGMTLAGLNLFHKTSFVSISLDSPDALEIQRTIRLSYEIDVCAAYYYDDSLFSAVYINDSRGGKITGTVLQLIQSVRNNYSLTESTVGFLDYKYAMNRWRKTCAAIQDQLWAKARSEGRDYLTSEQLKSLRDSTGRICPSPLPTPAPPNIYPAPLSIHFDTSDPIFNSISVKGDIAKAIFQDDGCKNKWTLVKNNGKWYIAGEGGKCYP